MNVYSQKYEINLKNNEKTFSLEPKEDTTNSNLLFPNNNEYFSVPLTSPIGYPENRASTGSMLLELGEVFCESNFQNTERRTTAPYQENFIFQNTIPSLSVDSFSVNSYQRDVFCPGTSYAPLFENFSYGNDFSNIGVIDTRNCQQNCSYSNAPQTLSSTRHSYEERQSSFFNAPPQQSICASSPQIPIISSSSYEKEETFARNQYAYQDSSNVSAQTPASFIAKSLKFQPNRYSIARDFHEILSRHYFTPEGEAYNSTDTQFFSIAQGDYDHVSLVLDRPISTLKKKEGEKEKNIGIKETMMVSSDQLLSIDLFLKLETQPRQIRFVQKTFLSEVKDLLEKKIKPKFFLSFVNLSLYGNFSDYEDNYLSWKNALNRDIKKESTLIRKRILSSPHGQKISGKLSLSMDNILKKEMSLLIRKIITHSLFSIPIESEVVDKKILVSRISFGRFLNKYSDYFVFKFLNYKHKGSNEKTGKKDSYPNKEYSPRRWIEFAKKEINQISNESHDEIRSIIDADHDDIRSKVLVFDGSNFKQMEESDFHGLMKLVYKLLDPAVDGGIFDRAARHFHKNILPATEGKSVK